MRDIQLYIQDYMDETGSQMETIIKDNSLEGIANYLVEKRLFHSIDDVKAFLLEAPIYMLSIGEVDLPIRYYQGDEPCEGVIDTGDEALTDNFIKQNLTIVK